MEGDRGGIEVEGTSSARKNVVCFKSGLPTSGT